MDVGRFELLGQRGAGRDGIAYRARATDGRPVEVRVLSGARADEPRWPDLAKRLRVAALLNHPAAVRVLEMALDRDPPSIVLEAMEGRSLTEELAGRLPLGEAEAAAIGLELAGALAAAHRLGLVHGRLSPSHIQRDAVRLKIDFTGTDTTPAEAASTPDAACRAPESAGTVSFPEGDLYSLGALLFWLLHGRSAAAPLSASQTIVEENTRSSEGPPSLHRLAASMLVVDPEQRPSAREVEAVLATLLGRPAATGEFAPAGARQTANRTVADRPGQTMISAGEAAGREQLGRFRLVRKLGEGGMGAVYRAEDMTDGTTVAVKLLRPDWAARPQALRRFHKEARLLAEVNNPYVTNLVEVNEDAGIHYLALEFVEGKTLGKLLAERGRLDEPTAMSIIADVARALVGAHDRGIVHRDIKPDNVLLAAAPADANGASSHRVKLTDFGLARHVVESESLSLTQTGTILGTPLYMAPEQCTGRGTVDARTDVYALGATLFHLLAGRPPFDGPTTLAVIAMHCNDTPPGLQKLNPAISDGACQIVEKCLAKSPEARYVNAGALLADLERVLRGEPTSITVHPHLPRHDPERLICFHWTWQLDASPEQLWPHVSNTERVNRAAGVPAVQFTSRVDFGQGVRRFGRFRKAGMVAAWEEHPFEWIEARRMGVLREYTQGPFRWMVSTVELAPRSGGGTTLTHRVRIEPTGILGRTLAVVEIGVRGRRTVERIYRRIDAAACGKLPGRGLADPFEEPPAVSRRRRRRLDALLDRLRDAGIEPLVVERLGDFLALAPAQEVARIRPLALARRLELDPDQVVSACLHGAREGLLVLLWDILCPVCRIPSQIQDTLQALRDHGHCEACNLDFDLDFANSVEMIFRVHPEVRDAEPGVYCIGGPAHSPHVVAQVRVGAGERVELDLALGEGCYRLRGPQLSFTLDFRVQAGAPLDRLDLSLSRSPDPAIARVLKAGGQLVVLTNDSPQELVARVERTVGRVDALTAARASALALFRELFPGEILTPGQLVSVANVTLLATDLERAQELYTQLGDAKAFAQIHDCFRMLNDGIRREGGALVKTVGEGVLAAFSDPVAALRAALEFPSALVEQETTRGLHLRVGIHRGPAMAATLNGQLDYFGTAVNTALALPEHARAGDVVLTGTVAAEPLAAAFLAARGLTVDVVTADLPGEAAAVLHRVRPKQQA
jgi:serine/threonine protein kinase/class 3 adenylate cyclase